MSKKAIFAYAAIFNALFIGMMLLGSCTYKCSVDPISEWGIFKFFNKSSDIEAEIPIEDKEVVA